MIDAGQRMITIHTQGESINPAVKKHYELQIKTLQDAPRDIKKLKRLLKIKHRQKDEAMHIEDTHTDYLQKRLKC
jgi:hypothetical protein